MLNRYYSELNMEIEKTIELCESPIERELLLKIIDFVLINSIFSFTSDKRDYSYKLTFLNYTNYYVEIGDNYEPIGKYKHPKKRDMFIQEGIRIDYSGIYENEFTRFIEILPQKTFYYYEDDEILGLPIIEKEFRLDFGVLLKDYKTNKLIKKFCIECDGYEYHSKQERIIRDNEREKKLLADGNYHTLRYLGKEINDMKSDEIKLLLDILFIEKIKEF